MKSKKMHLAFIGSAMIFVAVFCVSTVLAEGLTGPVCVTANTHVDGPGHCKGKTDKCCHVFDGKKFVWLNGSGGFQSDGQYFFAVLLPGGVLNPNDGGPTNMSDDYDAYTNRTFTVTNGAVSAYYGTHDLDGPYIRLFPYADTLNPGGIYIMAVCSLDQGYPVDPSSCS